MKFDDLSEENQILDVGVVFGEDVLWLKLRKLRGVVPSCILPTSAR